jgi:hypothetical protein
MGLECGIKVARRAATTVTDSLLPGGLAPRMEAFSLFHVAKLGACPLRSWDAIYAEYDILASAHKAHNNQFHAINSAGA